MDKKTVNIPEDVYSAAKEVHDNVDEYVTELIRKD